MQVAFSCHLASLSLLVHGMRMDPSSFWEAVDQEAARWGFANTGCLCESLCFHFILLFATLMRTCLQPPAPLPPAVAMFERLLTYISELHSPSWPTLCALPMSAVAGETGLRLCPLCLLGALTHFPVLVLLFQLCVCVCVSYMYMHILCV